MLRRTADHGGSAGLGHTSIKRQEGAALIAKRDLLPHDRLTPYDTPISLSFHSSFLTRSLISDLDLPSRPPHPPPRQPDMPSLPLLLTHSLRRPTKSLNRVQQAASTTGRMMWRRGRRDGRAVIRNLSQVSKFFLADRLADEPHR